MEKTGKTLCYLGSLYGMLEPGDVFYLLNDGTPHIVVLIFEDGIVDEEGVFVRKNRPVRYPAENVKEFDLNSKFFDSDDVEVIFGEFTQLPVGAIIVIFDLEEYEVESEKIEARFEVIVDVNIENKIYTTTAGYLVGFVDDYYFPTGVVIGQETDVIEVDESGENLDSDLWVE